MLSRFGLFLVAVLGFAPSLFASGLTVTQSGNSAVVEGTSAGDHIVLEEWVPGQCFVIDVNAGYEVCDVLDLSEVVSITINGRAGDDLIENRNVDILFFANGNGGQDTILGSDLKDGYDEIDGGTGCDFIYGGYGFEYINGGSSDDYIWLANWSGDDCSGGTVVGGSGKDTIVATAFNDFIVAEDGEVDIIDCVGGNDFSNEFTNADSFDEISNCDDGGFPE